MRVVDHAFDPDLIPLGKNLPLSLHVTTAIDSGHVDVRLFLEQAKTKVIGAGRNIEDMIARIQNDGADELPDPYFPDPEARDDIAFPIISRNILKNLRDAVFPNLVEMRPACVFTLLEPIHGH